MRFIDKAYDIWIWILDYTKSASFTVHFSFGTLASLIIVLLCIAYNLVKTRYLRNYSKLPLEPQRKEQIYQTEHRPETREGESAPGLHNYLDEFLSAIKVFGYLEKHVFHELTRHMQTRKLLAGETLNLEEEKSFCIVVDGHVQVFFKTDRPSSPGDEYTDIENGYRLLTDVRNGNIKLCI